MYLFRAEVWGIAHGLHVRRMQYVRLDKLHIDYAVEAFWYCRSLNSGCITLGSEALCAETLMICITSGVPVYGDCDR